MNRYDGFLRSPAFAEAVALVGGVVAGAASMWQVQAEVLRYLHPPRWERVVVSRDFTRKSARKEMLKFKSERLVRFRMLKVIPPLHADQMVDGGTTTFGAARRRCLPVAGVRPNIWECLSRLARCSDLIEKAEIDRDAVITGKPLYHFDPAKAERVRPLPDWMI